MVEHLEKIDMTEKMLGLLLCAAVATSLALVSHDGVESSNRPDIFTDEASLESIFMKQDTLEVNIQTYSSYGLSEFKTLKMVVLSNETTKTAFEENNKNALIEFSEVGDGVFLKMEELDPDMLKDDHLRQSFSQSKKSFETDVKVATFFKQKAGQNIIVRDITSDGPN